MVHRGEEPIIYSSHQEELKILVTDLDTKFIRLMVVEL